MKKRKYCFVLISIGVIISLICLTGCFEKTPVKIFSIIDNTISGSVYNDLYWNTIDDTINSNIYNSSEWNTINDTVNGSICSSQGLWNMLNDTTIYGSIFTASVDWYGIIEIYGTIYNATEIPEI